MCHALGIHDVGNEVMACANQLYAHERKLPALNKESRVELLDALADQVVTATGVAYFSQMQWDEALNEVNNSNFSKFEDGKPVLNEHGKIIKGKNYFKPNLAPFTEINAEKE